MKQLLLITSLAMAFTTYAQVFFDKADTFFKGNVQEGVVDYKSIKASPDELNELVRLIAEHDLSDKRVTPEYMKAFYVNAYNILVIRQVIDQYPVYGPLKVDGFFDKTRFEVMGEMMTLNQLEKETLYKQFPDPRLHFVLVCAAKGCPPLMSGAYFPSSFEETLEKRTKYVLNLDWFVKSKDGKGELSQIFSWYQRDFQVKGGSVTSYINQYRIEKINETKNPKYYEYDWSLNE